MGEDWLNDGELGVVDAWVLKLFVDGIGLDVLGGRQLPIQGYYKALTFTSFIFYPSQGNNN